MKQVFISLTMPDDWVKEISQKYTVSIKFVDCIPHGDQGWKRFFEMKGNEEELEKIQKYLKNHPSVSKIDMSFINKGVIAGTVFFKNCVVCSTLADSGCHLISGKCNEDGSVEWRLITGDEEALALLIKNLEKNGCEVKLLNTNKRTLLTQRQRNIVQIAFEKGYYDYPKKITIKKLSNIFNISPSTLGEILQRGEKKIILEHFRKF